MEVVIMENQESVALIQHKFENGVYSLRQMVEFVEKKWITKDDFHWITSYNYEGVKKSRGW